jgi:hypothetical protein
MSIPDIKLLKESNDCSISHIKNATNKDLIDDNVCLDVNVIKNILEIIPKSKINKEINKEINLIDSYLKIRENNNCDDDICLIKIIENKIPEQLKNIINKNIDENFKPIGPANSKKWFNNDNIDHTFYHMELAYPEYIHIPYQMIDFNKFDNPLNNLNVKELLDNGKKMTGCVLNTDVSTGIGLHWFCVFIDMRDIKNVTIEFFNSSGNLPRPSVHEWMIKMENQFSNLNIKCKRVIVSKNRHQKSDTECGPYSCYFIIQRIQNTPYNVFLENRIPDEKMYEIRKSLFRIDTTK